MKKTTMAAIASALAIAFASCNNKSGMQAEQLDGEWDVITIKGYPAVEPLPYIGFDMKVNTFYGNASCNMMNGSLETGNGQNPASLSFGQIATTRMLCEDMKQEQMLIDALGKVSAFNGNNDTVSLSDGNGKVMATLARRAPIRTLTGRWKITTVKGLDADSILYPENRTVIPYIEFDDANSRIHCNAGCNTINGSFSQQEGDSNSITFGQTMVTMMSCHDMELEQLVLQALNEVTGFEIINRTSAAFSDKSGTVVITIEKE